MNSVQEDLIHIIANQLFGANFTVPDSLDCKPILAEAEHQAVFPAVFSYLEKALSSKESIIQYKNQNAQYLALNIRNLYYHAELHKLLSDHGIPYVALKGQASSYYYPNPLLRAMGDVDFLVQTSDIGLVDDLLRAQGFYKQKGTEKHDYHWAYKKDNESLEMHWDIPGMPQKNNETIKAYLADIINKRQVINRTGGEIAIPSAFHHGLVLLLHTISHMTSSGVGLRHLCDWLVFENSMAENDFVCAFENSLEDIGLWTFAQILTKTGVLFFGCAEREWCKEADEAICAAFLEDILVGGNFGAKDNTRLSQAKLIRNNVTKEVTDKDILKNILISINEKAKRDYPVVKKNPILLPVGWILVCAQYLYHIARGRRNNVFDRTILTDAVARKKLYSELKLFEVG